MEQDKSHTNQSILFFDGVCNLCDGFVQWLIKRDKKRLFKFASLQSEFTKSFLIDLPENKSEINTVVLYHKGHVYTHSDVSLEIARLLGGFWSIFYVFKLVPRFVRDGVYNWIAKRRYVWFGKKDQCMIPSPEISNRFLDSIVR